MIGQHLIFQGGGIMEKDYCHVSTPASKRRCGRSYIDKGEDKGCMILKEKRIKRNIP